MFELKNILNFAAMNIQTLGIFIAIIGGIIVTKFLNLKIEKDSLNDKLNIINMQIKYDDERINKRQKRINQNNRVNFIDNVYDHVFDQDFNLNEYDKCGLTDSEAIDICDKIRDNYAKAHKLFCELCYDFDDIDKLLLENKIYESDEMYWVYHNVACEHAQKGSSRLLYNVPNVSTSYLTSKITTLQDNLEERDLMKSYEELHELRKWRIIEKENLEIKIKAINANLKFDFITFGIITIFGVVIPQIIISIYPIFINYNFLKYAFAIYSIFSFIGSMLLMIIYIYRMYKVLKK